MDLKELSNSVTNGEFEKIKELTQQAIDEGIDASQIINDGLIAGMMTAGQKWKDGEMFMPEVLMSAHAMHEGMNLVKPLLSDQDISTNGTVLLGTVEDDLHDIGKNLVGMMLESSGYKVIDIGIDVPAETFAEKVKEVNPDIVAMSALLTTTMMAMKKTIDVLKEHGVRDKVKIIVGGAPVSQEFADEIGADGYASDAANAPEVVEDLINN